MSIPLILPERNGLGEEGSLPPPLKWAGGKRWLVPYLSEIYGLHRNRTLVELFAGGMAVTLGLLPERARLNDINPHLINFYRWIQRGLVVDIPLANDENLYYEHRRRFNRLIREGLWESKEAAELFYYLNRTGYNGLCRFNKKGEFNVPFGKYKTIAYRRHFLDYQPLFSRFEFTALDFRQVSLQPEDFVYADPPYDVEFTKYAPDGFSWKDQVDLAELLSTHPGPVVISNQATRRIVDLYKSLGYELRFLDAPRRISCDGNRQPALEVLALRNL
ncbi:MAG: DNA adenine methylase [Thermus sp.]|uniref:DNA adenine methylase n=1 Tax=Thermus sp. TaxID=275 RepID=UPI00391CE3DD